MKYAEYKKKMEKRAKALNMLYRFRIPIIVTVSVAITAALTFTGLNGQAREVKLEETELVYGESPVTFSKSMFGDALTQYSPADKDDWSFDVPTKAGTYKVRAVSKNGFGRYTYSASKEFTIAPKPLEITLNTTELTYGNEISYSNNLNRGDTIDNLDFIFADNYNQLNPFGDKNIFDTSVTIDLTTLKILNSELEDITYCYSYENPAKDLKVKKRTLHLISSETEKDYDGTAITNENYYTSQDTSLAPGDEISLTEVTSQTDVGTINIKNSVKIMHDDIDRTAFYDVSWNTPTLTVNKRKITISTNSIQRTYNGQGLSSDESASDENKLLYSVSSGSLLESHHFAEVTFASENAYKPLQNSPNSITYKILDENGDDVTNTCYQITEQFGNITINKANIDVTYANYDEEFVYQQLNGSASVLGVIENDTFTYALKSGYDSDSLDQIGYLAYAYDFTITNPIFGDVTDCYNISFTNGQSGSIQIRQKNLIIQSNDLLDVLYDGTPFSQDLSTPDEHRLSFEYLGLLEGHRIEVYFDAEGDLFANRSNSFAFNIFDENDNEVSALYNITPFFGQITSKKRDLTIKFDSNNWIYDGNSHLQESYSGTGVNGDTGLASTDQIQFTDSYPSITSAGKIDNYRPFNIYNATANFYVNDYYNIPDYTQLVGSLEVSKRVLTLHYNEPADKMYDGQEVEVNLSDIIVDNLPTGLKCDLYVGGTGSFRAAGEYSVDLYGAHIYHESNPSENLEENFILEFDNNQYPMYSQIHLGDFAISKRPLTLSTYSATKIYDSTALTSQDAATNAGDTNVYVITGGEGLVSGDTVQVSTMSSITQTGTKVNQIIYQINSIYGLDMTSSYDITTNFGNLTIEQADLSIEFIYPTNYTYDSQYHGLVTTNNITGLQGSDEFVFTNVQAYRDAGTYPLEDCFSYKIYNSDGLDVTSSYKNIEIIGSPMVINKFDLNIHMEDFQRDLFNRNIPPINYTSNFYMEYDSLSVTYEGTNNEIKEQIEQGIYPSVLCTIYHVDNQVEASENYNITITYGENQLTITEVYISLQSQTATYFGEEYVLGENYSHESFFYNTNLPYNFYYQGLKVGCDDSLNHVGSYDIYLKDRSDIKIMYYDSETGETVDATSYFHLNFTSETTTFTLTKPTVYVYDNHYDVTYDGSYYSIQLYGLYGDHHFEVVNGFSEKNAGVYTCVVNGPEDIIIKDGKGNDVTDLYDISIQDSLLGETFTTTINKRHIEIETPNIEKYFDGTPFYASNLINSRFSYPIYLRYDSTGDGVIDSYNFFEYDSTERPNKIGAYLYGDYIELEFPSVTASYHVGTYVNDFQVSIYKDHANFVPVDGDNYEITKTTGELKIKKKAISYKASSTKKSYNGQVYTYYDDLTKKSNDDLVVLDLSYLPEAVRTYINSNANCAYASVAYNEMSFLVGTYSLDPTFVIIYNGEDLVAMGDIEFISSNGKVKCTINKTNLTILNEYQEIVITRWNPKASEKLIINGLIKDDYVYIGTEKYDASKTDYLAIADMKVAGTYGADYLSQYINSESIKIYRDVNGVTVDVTSCYNIRYNFSNIVVSDF